MRGMVEARALQRQGRGMTTLLDQVSPQVLHLASLASLATRIEPQLLRHLRLELAPDLAPGVEAELWFSPLVAQAAATGIVLHPEALAPLRSRLKAAGRMLDRAWHVTRSVHEGGSPVLLAEEELAWLATRGLSDPADLARARELMQRLLATMIDPGSHGLVNWAQRAVVHLPEPVFALEEARMLALAASYRGATIPSSHADRFPQAKQAVPWLMPKEQARRLLGVRLVAEGVEFGPADLDGMHLLTLPPGREVAITIAGKEEGGWREVFVHADAKALSFVPFEAREYRIGIRGGESFTLRIPSKEPSFVRRTRPPRVSITYEDPYEYGRQVSLPFVLGIIAPLLPESCQGNLAPWEERQFEDLTDRNIDALMERIAPAPRGPFNWVDLPNSNSNGIATLTFRKMSDFSPDFLCEMAKVRPSATSDSTAKQQSSESFELSRHLNQMIHSAVYEELEAAWRGLDYLLKNAPRHEDIKIMVLPCSMQEVAKDLAAPHLEDTSLYKKIVESTFGQLGGEPFGMVVLDTDFAEFDRSSPVLSVLSDLGAAATCPIITNAPAMLCGLKTWGDIAARGEEAATSTASLIPQESVLGYGKARENPTSRWLGLCMPRVVARLPYGGKRNPIESFAFEDESTEPLMMGAAYAFAVNVARAHADYGWPVRIRGVQSGGLVDTLTGYTFPTSAGGIALNCPTEIALSDQIEADLGKAGLIPLVHRANTDTAVFLGAQSLYRPKMYSSEQAIAAEHLSARLPYMLAMAKFATAIRCMVRDKIGSSMDQQQLEHWINDWLQAYIDADPANSSETMKAQKPIAAGRFAVDRFAEGFAECTLDLRPTYQLEGMDVGLSLSFRLPGFYALAS